ncbi:hypothetical protein CBR_g66804 [Chara braunii]|uniref:Uncharacterized protein n=1 Tax=Chara braunii TaxID=69332 RepID=A0A388K9G8_CHABU|nr:hypothetical protein CBR_g66804 [Chara braunii]|eukprot:GBG66669.1 hypothetical protein CBR_g66804 [Chara braunii]
METEDILKGFANGSKEGNPVGGNTTDCAEVLATMYAQTAEMMGDGDETENDAGASTCEMEKVGEEVLRLNDEATPQEKRRYALEMWRVLEAQGEFGLNDFLYDSFDCGQSWVIGGNDATGSTACHESNARRDPSWGWVPCAIPIPCGRVRMMMRDAMGNVWSTHYVNDNFSFRNLVRRSLALREEIEIVRKRRKRTVENRSSVTDCMAIGMNTLALRDTTMLQLQWFDIDDDGVLNRPPKAPEKRSWEDKMSKAHHRTKKRITYKKDRMVEMIDLRGSNDMHSAAREEAERNTTSPYQKSLTGRRTRQQVTREVIVKLPTDILATLTTLMTRTVGAATAQRRTRAVTGQAKMTEARTEERVPHLREERNARGNPKVAAREAQPTRPRLTDD